MNELAVMLGAPEVQDVIEEVSKSMREIEERMNREALRFYLELEREVVSLLVD